MAEMVYRIKPNGALNIETIGTIGTECTKIVETVHQSIGGKITEDTNKPEYYAGGQSVHTNLG